MIKKLIFIFLLLLPVFVLSQDLIGILYTDENGKAILPDYSSMLDIHDNCELSEIYQSPSAGFVVEGQQVLNVTVRAYDIYYNSKTIYFNVYVIDTFQFISFVTIGGQVWMAANLRVSTFNDGTPIPQVEDYSWANLTSPAYCWYNNDSAMCDRTIGKLYNYYAINSGKLCPVGWRMPTEEDYQQLINYLDPEANFVRHEISYIAGGKMKGLDYWLLPNIGATNESGFSALPGGCRSYAGNFSMGGTFGYYGFVPNQGSIAMRWCTGSLFMRDGISEYVGVSVRCIKE